MPTLSQYPCAKGVLNLRHGRVQHQRKWPEKRRPCPIVQHRQHLKNLNEEAVGFHKLKGAGILGPPRNTEPSNKDVRLQTRRKGSYHKWICHTLTGVRCYPSCSWSCGSSPCALSCPEWASPPECRQAAMWGLHTDRTNRENTTLLVLPTTKRCRQNEGDGNYIPSPSFVYLSLVFRAQRYPAGTCPAPG